MAAKKTGAKKPTKAKAPKTTKTTKSTKKTEEANIPLEKLQGSVPKILWHSSPISNCLKKMSSGSIS